MGRSKEEILPDLEALIVEYMQAGTEIESLVLQGFVLKAQATDIAKLGDAAEMGTVIWATPAHQSIFMSMGLAEALVQDVSMHYGFLYEGADWQDDDE